MDSAGLYVMDRGKISGPYSEHDLISMSSRGVCSPFSKVSPDRQSWTGLNDYLNDRQARLNAPAPLRPPPLTPPNGVSPLQGFPTTLGSKLLRPFPLVALLLLHYLTLGTYTFIAITAVLGGLPKIRTDDPSSGKAIGLCFLPLYNVYWVCLIYPRLGHRINGLATTFGLLPTVPRALTYCLSACIVIPLVMATVGCAVLSILFISFPREPHQEAWYVFFVIPHVFTLINYLIIWPWFSVAVQTAINRVFELQVAILLSQNTSTFANSAR